jgi:hypothetical protein
MTRVEPLRISRETAEAWERCTGLTGFVKKAVELGYWELVDIPTQQKKAAV